MEPEKEPGRERPEGFVKNVKGEGGVESCKKNPK